MLYVAKRSPWGNAWKPETNSDRRDVGSTRVRITLPDTASQTVVRPSPVTVATAPPPSRMARATTQSECSSSRKTMQDEAFHIIALLSKPPVTILSLFGKTAATSMFNVWPRRTQLASPVSALQIVAHSRPQVTRLLPDGKTSILLAEASLSVATFSAGPSRQMMHGLSLPHVTIRSPLGKTRPLLTAPPCSCRDNCDPVEASQTMALPSSLHVKTRSPRGKNLMPVISAVWPCNTCRGPSGPQSVTELQRWQEATW
mmetsp:Transcript_78384/g.227508  ORF Transcript_78384/g.227508 Transcript_78384/m.227508 type:complete len:257 (+) Transcript_78384:277-1047(+)